MLFTSFINLEQISQIFLEGVSFQGFQISSQLKSRLYEVQIRPEEICMTKDTIADVL